MTREFTIHEFVAFLKVQYRAVIERKEESQLFNASVFDPPEGADGFRKKEYFRASSFMALDFDNGNLSKDDFVRIFWTEAGRGQKRSFLICNSFSRCEALPNKFRVILFYKRLAWSLHQHEAVYDAVVDRLAEHGYSAKSAKLDPACKSGVQSFYLPCTNRAHQEWAFFEIYGLKTRDLERCAIDPIAYGRTALSAPIVPQLRANSILVPPANREQIDAATETLRSMKEGRNHELFMTGCRLRGLGLTQSEIEAELWSIIGRERHMRKKIPGVTKSLRKYRRL